MNTNPLSVSKTMLELDDAIAQLRAHDEKAECCSFCHKPKHEVSLLVPGPNSIFICDQCVERAAKLVGQRT